MSPYRIVLTDDHIMLRQGIKKIIEESPDMVVVGEANDGLELLHLLTKITSDMIVLDISMPHLRGLEATSEIKMTHPEIHILILSMHKDTEYVQYALSAGAHGYILKEDTDTELLSAIETIRYGKIYVSRLLSNALLNDMMDRRFGKGHGGVPQDPLTIRERQALHLIAEGKSSKEIADLLCLSVRTVEHHRASMMRKLHLKNLADLVKYAMRHGYTSDAT